MAASNISREYPNSNPPDGWRWAMVRYEEQDTQRRDDELIRFDDPEYSNIEEFKYKKLSDMRRTIRLLKLEARARETSEIKCELHEVRIDDGQITQVDGESGEGTPESYEALSWAWPTTNSEHQILIRDGSGLRKKRISQELVWALRYLRYPGKDRTLWIDAICIDQESVEEKNHQVQMMSQIYSYAGKVCIWLGLDDRHSKMAINFIKEEILQVEHFDALCSNPKNSEKWHSLLILMQRRWFFRRWVVQEIALARDATIYCGPDHIEWKDFSVAVELFVEVETATHRLSEVMKKDPQYYHVSGMFDHVSALGASLLVTATGMIYRHYKPENQVKAIESAKDDDTIAKSHEFNAAPAPIPPIQDTSHSNNKRGLDNEDSDHTDANTNALGKFGGIHHSTRAHFSTWAHFDNWGHSDNWALFDDDDDIGSDATSSICTAPTALNGNAWKGNPISERRELLSLEYLVSTLSIFEATQPRDAIYSLLAIAFDCYPSAPRTGEIVSQIMQEMGSPTDQQPFPVDYGRDYTDVCQDFIDFCIARSDPTRALDIICRPWAPDPKPGIPKKINTERKTKPYSPKLESLDMLHNKKRNQKAIPHIPGWKDVRRLFPPRKDADQDVTLPSWIPRLDGAPFAMYSQAGIHIMKMGRKNADPLVGLPQNSPTSRNYNAAQGTKLRDGLRFQKRRWQNSHCMFVAGFVLDTVETITDSSQSGNIPISWLNLGQWNYRDPNKDKDPPEEFWRTIVADRGKDGHLPPYYYSRACRESVYKGGLASGAVDTGNLINNGQNSIVAQFCRRVQAVIWNKSLIRTRNGHLGLASKDVRKGDRICILYGCSVPVVLRRKEKSAAVLALEEDEDRRELDKLSKLVQRAMQRYMVKKRRKEMWINRPPEDREEIRKALKKMRATVFTDTLVGKSLKTSAPTPMSHPTTSGLQFTMGTTPSALHPKSSRKIVAQIDTSSPTEETSDSRSTKSGPKINVSKDYYEFLGECYIHGMMDGEAMRRKTDYEERKKEHLRLKRQAREKEQISRIGRIASNDNIVNGIDGNSNQRTKSSVHAAGPRNGQSLKRKFGQDEVNFANANDLSMVQPEPAAYIRQVDSPNNKNLELEPPTTAKTKESSEKEYDGQGIANEEVTDNPTSRSSGEPNGDGSEYSKPADKGKKATFVEDVPAEQEEDVDGVSQAIPDDHKTEDEDLEDLEGDILPDLIFELR